MQHMIHMVECPRDAMQGWKHPIPTSQKVDYLNALLRVGFHTLDCGSFVSPKAIPQMADTAEVLKALDMSGTDTKLLTIVANQRGAAEAVAFEQVSYLGFPFSISPTFQMRNTNSTIDESLVRVQKIQDLCIRNNKELVIYISMGFGNPYGDAYHEDIVLQWVERIIALDIKIVSMADTVGVATAEQVAAIMSTLLKAYPEKEIGVHLHSTPSNWRAKVDAALQAGCRRFDGALKGIGGCPMADDELVGNMDTELMLPYFNDLQLLPAIDRVALAKASALATAIFA